MNDFDVLADKVVHDCLLLTDYDVEGMVILGSSDVVRNVQRNFTREAMT